MASMQNTPRRRAAATTASAPATVAVNAFSTRAATPASMAASATSRWC